MLDARPTAMQPDRRSILFQDRTRSGGGLVELQGPDNRDQVAPDGILELHLEAAAWHPEASPNLSDLGSCVFDPTAG